MSRYLRIAEIREITPSDFDGHRYRLAFEVGEKDGDIFVPSGQYALEIEASGTLQVVWGRSDEGMQVSSASSAASQILALASEDRLDELQTLKLNTYTAPKEPPTTPLVKTGGLLPIPERRPMPGARAGSFLSGDISEVRDNINALAKNLWGDRVLLLSQERPLLDMYKPVRTAEEFGARLQSLAIIVKDLDKGVLARIAGIEDPKNMGQLVLLELALATIVQKDEVEAICGTFKNINNLRQRYPAHGDNVDKVLPAHHYLRLPYPIADYEAAWESVLGRYLRAMRAMRDSMAAAWNRTGQA